VLVNMTPRELQRFLDSPLGKVAGLSAAAARAQGIKSGRESARWILRMKATLSRNGLLSCGNGAKSVRSRSSNACVHARALLDNEGNPTRKLLSLLVWGHDPWK